MDSKTQSDSEFPRLAVVLVVYRELLAQSPSFISLGYPVEPTTLIVCDNSPQPQVVPGGIHYIHNPHNPGVSAAYNQAAQIAASKGCTHLVLADQDSRFPPEYLSLVRQAIRNSPGEKIFFPFVKTETHLISPALFRFGRAWYPRSSHGGILDIRRHRPINSGLVIELEHFQLVGGYDEAVFLDYSDFAFVERSLPLTKVGMQMDCIVLHSLASEQADKAAALRRFALYSRSVAAFARRYHSPPVLFWLLLRRISLALQYRTLAFLLPA